MSQSRLLSCPPSLLLTNEADVKDAARSWQGHCDHGERDPRQTGLMSTSCEAARGAQDESLLDTETH